MTNLKTLRQSAERATIEGLNTDVFIRTKLLEHADLMIELDIAVAEFNQLAAEHNHLVDRYELLLSHRERARTDLVENYMNNPAYRVIRLAQTVEAERNLNVAAQFAYLTAKALEYEYFLKPLECEPTMGCFDDVFKARTADDLYNYLDYLSALYEGTDPGSRNPYRHKISLTRDLLGLSDESLDPGCPDNCTMTPEERRQLRFTLFQDFLQQHTVSNTVEIHFATSLLDNNLEFSEHIWGDRFAGVGMPSEFPETKGVSINIITDQYSDIGTPEIKLVHGGITTYRNEDGQIVEYNPGRTALVGYGLPNTFEGSSTTILIQCSVNGNGGMPNSGLYNRSVAASDWKLIIPLTGLNDKLDISKLEDIEINIDHYGIAIQGDERAAEMDSLRSLAAFDDTSQEEPVHDESEASSSSTQP